MAKNFVQEGKVLTLTAPSGGVVSGNTYKIGSLIVVALVTADEGASFTAATEGVFTLAKTTSQAWSAGALLYWNNSGTKWTTVAEDMILAGYAAAAAGSADTTGKVLLCQIGATVQNLS